MARLIDDPSISNLNTTNYRIVVGVRLTVVAYALMGVVWVAEVFRGKEAMANAILDTAMLALFGILGLGTAQYASKRFSDKGLAAVKAVGIGNGLAAATAEHPAVSIIAKDQSTVNTTVPEQPPAGD